MLSVGIGITISAVSLGQFGFQRRILRGYIRLNTQEVSEEQSNLLIDATGTTNVDMLARLSWRLAEVALRHLQIFGTKRVPQALKRYTEGIERLKIND
ncbi:hypothetical protein KSB_06390 [Ktedonobacter robiniae]|uniref:Uncharacterized protein n=1 Tax=Ktedonobacter robiniae TaxID=2778365 RepID=A0ABQ3UHH9_9CHLR|nr:hypothetical protein KSB_06390 [Ktedonobacter robiniae]